MMRLRTKYMLLVAILHGVTLVLSYFVFKENKILFIVSEVLILFSIFLSRQLYWELIRPLKLLMQGAEAIKDRDFNVKYLLSGRPETDALIGVYNQMIDELRAERTKQEQQHFFLEKLINTSPTGILILDFDENVHRINPKALQFLGMNEVEVLGKSIASLGHPVFPQIRNLDSGQSVTFMFNSVVTFKLQRSHFIDRGFPRHFIMMEELSGEILAAEKKAYGKVIRMMAHEVNNSIGAVNSILQTALTTERIWADPTVHPLKMALQVATDRNYNLNGFMRNFAEVVRLPEPKRKKLDLHVLLTDVGRLMELKTGKKKIQFQYLFTGYPFLIVADGQQLEQVLINIVKNGMEAIEESNEEKGTISFASDETQGELIISDSGIGIPGETADQLFSPFFSTKREGQGIGLTLVKEILLNHGYTFSLKTVRPGHTEFRIFFK